MGSIDVQRPVWSIAMALATEMAAIRELVKLAD
jgi:hypothetical protein